MDKADADFLQQLFRENNNLRGTVTNLKRQLHNATSVLQESELDFTGLKGKYDELVASVANGGAGKEKFSIANVAMLARGASQMANNLRVDPNSAFTTAAAAAGAATAGAGVKDAGELKFIVERQEAEIFQLGEELYKLRAEVAASKERNINLERETSSLKLEVADLRIFEEKAREEKEEFLKKQATIEPDLDQKELKRQLANCRVQCDEYKSQVLDFAIEANQIQNSQQNQLQGVESMIDGIRDEYEEFITITRIENESFQERQKSEYNTLKEEFEAHKTKAFEDKKRTMMEYQNILSSMQAQFDEYRITTEMLSNVEVAKLEEEISSQATRYEQEIMYVIQAKDKFYLDMMVTKDAKIMGLIEGSDLQTIMQKHELDVENMRKEHAKDVERVKTEHESESKNVMLLLQRQNVSLESKTDKLQSHLKTIETRMKELMNTIDQKNKTIMERDDTRVKLEAEYQKKLVENQEKITKLIQEKERLRHKVIRLNLHAKGEGENSIENMIKRLSNDTNHLKVDFEDLGIKYNTSITENQEISKKLREKEKLCLFMERELERRGQEYRDMTNTFEEFLAARSKQAKKERNEKLLKIATEQEKIKELAAAQDTRIPQLGPVNSNSIIKSIVPDRGHKVKEAEVKNGLLLDRGYMYLKRFKNLSKAFATGDFRPLSNIEQQVDTNTSGPWQKISLYTKLEDTSAALAKLYHEDSAQVNKSKAKASLYSKNATQMAGVKVYKEVPKTPVAESLLDKPRTSREDDKKSGYSPLRVGGGVPRPVSSSSRTPGSH